MVARKLGMEVERPEIDGITGLYLEAFYSLSRSRSGTGYGALPIQISEIQAWHSFIKSPLDPESLLFVVQSLDAVYLKHLSRKK
jgi:hypothetical protein